MIKWDDIPFILLPKLKNNGNVLATTVSIKLLGILSEKHSPLNEQIYIQNKVAKNLEILYKKTILA